MPGSGSERGTCARVQCYSSSSPSPACRSTGGPKEIPTAKPGTLNRNFVILVSDPLLIHPALSGGQSKNDYFIDSMIMIAENNVLFCCGSQSVDEPYVVLHTSMARHGGVRRVATFSFPRSRRATVPMFGKFKDRNSTSQRVSKSQKHKAGEAPSPYRSGKVSLGCASKTCGHKPFTDPKASTSPTDRGSCWS